MNITCFCMMFNICLVLGVYLVGLIYKIYVSLLVRLSEYQVLKIGIAKNANILILTSSGVSDRFSDRF